MVKPGPIRLASDEGLIHSTVHVLYNVRVHPCDLLLNLSLYVIKLYFNKYTNYNKVLKTRKDVVILMCVKCGHSSTKLNKNQ